MRLEECAPRCCRASPCSRWRRRWLRCWLSVWCCSPWRCGACQLVCGARDRMELSHSIEFRELAQFFCRHHRGWHTGNTVVHCVIVFFSSCKTGDSQVQGLNKTYDVRESTLSRD